MKNLLLALIISMLSLKCYAQSTEIKPGSVLPQMTTAQRTALAAVNGMLVFDTGTQSYWARRAGVWTEVPTSTAAVNFWQQTGAGGNEIKNTNSGGFWSANPVGLTGVVTNITNPPTAPVSGAGTRMMWIPSRSAFRVGTASSTDWDAANIGLFSFASGVDTKASGKYSTAMGVNTIASNDNSTAMGTETTASGLYSTAMGYSTTANGFAAIAMGYITTASGFNSTAMGFATIASGNTSTAMGSSTIANGDYSTSMGKNCKAEGIYSNVWGIGAIATHEGSMILSDASLKNYSNGTYLYPSEAINQFKAVFTGGYKFYTSGTIGLQLSAGGNAWATISDSTKKQNLLSVNGEDFLYKIAKLKLTSWNYKGQDAKAFRHYGPMAQDFYQAFGKDSLGTIGCDTLINQADFDGVNLIAIQALEKRTQELTRQNEEMKNQHLASQILISKLQNQHLASQNLISKLENQHLASQILISKLENQHLESQILISKLQNQHLASQILTSNLENQHLASQILISNLQKENTKTETRLEAIENLLKSNIPTGK